MESSGKRIDRRLAICAASIIDDLRRIPGKVSDDGIDLPQRDLHSFSLKQSWKSAVTLKAGEWNRNMRVR